MPLVTEIWSARSYVPATSATAAYLVSDVGDELTAAGLCPVTTNATFRLDVRLRAGKPKISCPDSPRLFKVEFDFAPASGGSGGATISDLAKPPTFHPQISLSTESVDADVKNNPIVNSARVSFSGRQNKRFPSIRYVYKRYETFFDGAQAIAYTGKINSDNFEMPGFGSVGPGLAFCESISVASAFDRTAQAILVQYTFELREDGFRTRIMDEGPSGWGYPTEAATPGSFTTLDGTPVNKSIRLNGFGGPYDAGKYKVGSVVAGNLATSPPGAEVEPGNGAVFLKYQLYNERPFSALLLRA
jgi:hypothetical protein